MVSFWSLPGLLPVHTSHGSATCHGSRVRNLLWLDWPKFVFISHSAGRVCWQSSTMGVVIKGYYSSNNRTLMMPTHFLFFLRFFSLGQTRTCTCGIRDGAGYCQVGSHQFDHLWPYFVTPASESHYIPSAFRAAVLTSGTADLVGTPRRRTFKKTVRNAAPMTRPKFAPGASESLSLYSRVSDSWSYVDINGAYQLSRTIPTWVFGKQCRFVRALVRC